MESDERVVVERGVQGGQGRRWERGGERKGEEEYTGGNNQGKYYPNNNLHAQNTSTCVSFYSINC